MSIYVERDKSAREAPFSYSSENPPPVDVLESKIFAIHSTPILPKGGVLVAGTRDIYVKGPHVVNMPSFRPTLHFSLGEMVQSHDGHTWDEYPYAVVAPLKSLTDQLVNVSTNDSFILGNYKMREADIIFVPEGADISALPPDVRVQFYDPQKGLRVSIDEYIENSGGWRVSMHTEGAEIGSQAYIGQTEVNNPKFFSALLAEYPHLSFGNDIDSDVGEAFRFGSTNQAIIFLLNSYAEYGLTKSTRDVKFYLAFIRHNLDKLDNYIASADLSTQAKADYRNMKRWSVEWLNIADTDLQLRERYGKTLSRAHEDVQDKLSSARAEPHRLNKIARSSLRKLESMPNRDGVSMDDIVAFMRAFSPSEVHDFIHKNADVFEGVDINLFYLRYATSRWIVVGEDRAREENLGQLIRSPEGVETSDLKRILKGISPHLSLESNKLGAALAVLKNPTVRELFRERLHYSFDADGPESLEDVLRADPMIKVLFDNKDPLSPYSEEVQELLRVLDKSYLQPDNCADYCRRYAAALVLASNVIVGRSKIADDAQRLLQPMRSTDEDSFRAGDFLGLYELLKRDSKSVADIWRRFDLEEEYKNRFLTDQEFWQSDYSLLEIYKILLSDRANRR